MIPWWDEIDNTDGISRDDTTLWLSASSIQSAYESDESEVRERMKLEEWCPVSHEDRIRYLVEHAFPLLFDDADVTQLIVPVPAVASNGDSVWLTVVIQGYSFTIIQKERSGPFDPVEESTASPREAGWVASVEEFEALPKNRQWEIVRG